MPIILFLKNVVKKKAYKALSQIISFTIALFLLVYSITDAIHDEFITKITPYFLGATVPIGIFIGYLIYLVQRDDKYFDKIKADLIDHKKKLNRLIDEGIDEENPFKVELLTWRIEYEINKLKGMSSNNMVLPIHKQFNYMRIVYSNLIKNLNEGDQYITISTLDFWQDHNLNLTDEVGFTGFLKYNIEAVIRGANIQRVIIVHEDLFGEVSEDKIATDRKTLLEVCKSIVQIEKHLMNEHINATLSISKKDDQEYQKKTIVERFNTRFRVLQTTEYRRIYNDYAPYSIITRNDNFQVAAFVEDLHTPGGLPKINVKFYNDKPESDKIWNFDEYRRKFNIQYNNYEVKTADQILKMINESIEVNIKRKGGKFRSQNTNL